MRSKYLGLWKSEKTGWYVSQKIYKKDIQGMQKDARMGLRIIVRFNKYYEPEEKCDTRKPRFIFTFVDCDDPIVRANLQEAGILEQDDN
jgi:hypothetical protein